ncbi:hypothetical protein MU1CBH_02010 [Megamonas funiformis]|nr:hypothetical protein MU1CBH_02010 [Megamonas funiformis]
MDKSFAIRSRRFNSTNITARFPFRKSKVRQYKKTYAHCRHTPLLTDNIIA